MSTSRPKPRGPLGSVPASPGMTAQALRYLSDYYPFGWTMPKRTDLTYRYGYQGNEQDPETGWTAFELRMYDPRLARWHTYDPKKQFASPYVSMGNNPVNGVDPDGGFFLSRWFANLFTPNSVKPLVPKNQPPPGDAVNYTVEVNTATNEITISNVLVYDTYNYGSEESANQAADYLNSLKASSVKFRGEEYKIKFNVDVSPNTGETMTENMQNGVNGVVYSVNQKLLDQHNAGKRRTDPHSADAAGYHNSEIPSIVIGPDHVGSLVPAHEVGHSLGLKHSGVGLMIENVEGMSRGSGVPSAGSIRGSLRRAYNGGSRNFPARMILDPN